MAEDDFFRSVLDAVHGVDPRHLVAGFEGFGDTFGLGHLPRQTFHHPIGLVVNLLQMGVEAPPQEHAVEDAAVVVAKVLVRMIPY